MALATGSTQLICRVKCLAMQPLPWQECGSQHMRPSGSGGEVLEGESFALEYIFPTDTATMRPSWPCKILQKAAFSFISDSHHIAYRCQRHPRWRNNAVLVATSFDFLVDITCLLQGCLAPK